LQKNPVLEQRLSSPISTSQPWPQLLLFDLRLFVVHDFIHDKMSEVVISSKDSCGGLPYRKQKKRSKTA
jgi:hypothetical protein